MASSILFIDDSPRYREQITAILQSAALFDLYRTANDGLEGFKALTAAKADLIICDMEMPHVNGLRFLQLVNSRPELRDIPIMILTGNHAKNVKLKGLEQGASDYLAKPFDAAELVARVKIHLKIKKLQDELKAANDHFRQLSTRDPLTGMYNRRFLADTLEHELQRACRLRSDASLLIVDIDHFKKVNDLYGHQAGDKVLVSVAAAIENELRIYDIASRYGGEEFVLVLPGTPFEGGLAVAERLRQSVQSLTVALPADRVTVTVSIGLAAYSWEKPENRDSLFSRADSALYRAKRNGRNRVEVADGVTSVA